MWKNVLIAAAAATVIAMSPVSPAAGGEWEYDPAADLILHDSVPVAHWYRPWIGTGPRHYYSHYPRHVPAYPQRLTGYPVPIYKAPARLPGTVVRTRGVRSPSHEEWCAARYRSYDVRTDTYQPYHGPRRSCRSPWR
jgi:hypothetical protein